jgi:methionyl-tRNA synthetase
MNPRLLVTSALPYANGPIHIGHLVEYIQTDIWVRFQRMRGRNVVYICADDTHGTSIMIRARTEGRSEEDVIGEMSALHRSDFERFSVDFDHFGSTNSPTNRALCGEVWGSLRQKGLIAEREVTQLFDPKAGVFLADRFVRGTCPRCGTADQYGDSCASCGSSYTPADLKDPVSTLSGARPELRSAQHYFVQIEKLHDFLADWTQRPGMLQPPEIANYIKGHFLSEPLRDWDVSRPAPYFGFEIPDAPGHYWYVWFDAPIGYMASTAEWCEQKGELFDDWWRSPATDIVHFIGKDIAYFHTLFWPAMLKSAGFTLPCRVQVHGFLTVNGAKMSKSKGAQLNASDYLDSGLDPQYLRYYYASKLAGGVEDLDLNAEEFAARIDSDLVGKVANLASRTARFVEATGLSEAYPDDGGLFETAAKAGDSIADAYESCDYARAMREIIVLADRANEYVARVEPWKLNKAPEKAAELRDVCTVVLNLYRQLAIYLAPVLPRLAQQSAELLGVPLTSYADAKAPVAGSRIGKFEHLIQRVDRKSLAGLLGVLEASANAAATATTGDAANAKTATPVATAAAARAQAEPATDDGAALAAEPLAPECSIDDFGKVDLRVARVIAAEELKEAKKLIKLTLSLGGDSTRTVFAGIKSAYAPADLVGRLVVVVANLAPRQMKFGTSEGMVIAAGPGGSDIFLLSPDSGAKPGQRVH